MKYRYIITNTLEGQVEGTNEEATAREFAESEDFFVADALNGKWLLPAGSDQDITSRD